MSPLDLVLVSFEIAAESGVDINQGVHESFIAASPHAQALMDHMDEHMLGRMMQEVLTVLMAQDMSTQRGYLNFEVDSHRAYGVEQSMYREFLVAVCETIRSTLGVQWNQGHQSAWEQRIAALTREIDLAAAAGG